MTNLYEKEIVELHDFFAGWFQGELPQTEDSFARFSRVLAPSFLIIAPNGTLTQRGALLKMLWGAHAAIPDVKIWIERVKVQHQIGDVIVATYEEWQTRAGETTVRLSTVLFEAKPDAPNGLRWVHVHETWITD